MSVQLNWDTLAGGPDGLLLAESIRRFIHDKFQQVPLPRFIRAVEVHAFELGKTPPEIEIKDICDPLPDFYEEDEDSEDEEDEEDEEQQQQGRRRQQQPLHAAACPPSEPSTSKRLPQPLHPNLSSAGRRDPTSRPPMLRPSSTAPLLDVSSGFRSAGQPPDQLLSPWLQRAPTPGIPGGTSNISYFHLPLSAGLSGTNTPLAAVAGAQFQTGSQPPGRLSHWDAYPRQHSASIGSPTPPSTADPGSRPPSQHQHNLSRRSSRIGADDALPVHDPEAPSSSSPPPRLYEPGPMDIQVVSHVKYAGDVKMVLTAEIHMDYPMQSFVGIPLKLTVTGLSFDGVAILAYIKRKAHFCFLSPEDAAAFLSNESEIDKANHPVPGGPADQTAAKRHPGGGLLEHIKVESEIGQKEDGKQVLKNVGKVEKFVLERVRKIFEEELVYPSFWTFLV